MNVQHTSTGTLKTPACTVQAKIAALDLEPVKFKLVKEKHWTPEKADRVEISYKAYLALFAHYPGEEHVPTTDIDDMWHAHILDTQKYMADCRDVFGYYLHHYPYLGLLGDADEAQASETFVRTRQRLLGISGRDLTLGAASCGGGCGGSSCGGSSCGSSGCGGCGDGGSSCSSGSSCCGQGGDGQSTPAGCGGDDSLIACSGGIVKKKRKEDDDAGKKPFWKRIWGAADAPDGWAASTDPRFIPKRRRPGRTEMLQLTKAAAPGFFSMKIPYYATIE